MTGRLETFVPTVVISLFLLPAAAGVRAPKS